MKTFNLFVISAVFLVFTGCSKYYPVPLDENDIKKGLKEDKGKKGPYGLDIGSTVTEAIQNMKDYSDWYILKAYELKSDEYKFSDASFNFGVLGLLAGIAKSPEGAAIGALLASGAEIPKNRYQLSIQSNNYKKASDTMHCMYRYLTPIQNKLDLTSELDFLNDKIYEVRQKLRESQLKTTLLEPDLDDIKTSMNNIIKKEKIIDENEKIIDEKEQFIAENKKVFGANEKKSLEEEKKSLEEENKKEKIKKVIEKINLCISQISN